MTEDVAGVLAAGTRRRYATCAECGQVFRADSPTEPAILEEDGYSEFTELCPTCDALDRQGETIPKQSDDEP
jgi:hypothetical protein